MVEGGKRIERLGAQVGRAERSAASAHHRHVWGWPRQAPANRRIGPRGPTRAPPPRCPSHSRRVAPVRPASRTRAGWPRAASPAAACAARRIARPPPQPRPAAGSTDFAPSTTVRGRAGSAAASRPSCSARCWSCHYLGWVGPSHPPRLPPPTAALSSGRWPHQGPPYRRRPLRPPCRSAPAPAYARPRASGGRGRAARCGLA
eukprot:scaffold5585_cov104-Isochrysis_galbana.AAC.2